MKQETDNQISLFEIKDDKLRNEISEIEINNLTPMEALTKLSDLKKRIQDNV
jgi:DNA mismatch repair protein MutS